MRTTIVTLATMVAAGVWLVKSSGGNRLLERFGDWLNARLIEHSRG